MTAPPPPKIEIRDLSVTYRRTPAVSEITLDIPAGEVTAIVGPSGSGKSTLLSALNRMTDLVEGAALQGTVLIGETDVVQPSTNVITLRRRVGMIFQRPNPLPMSIRRNLALPLREHGVRDRAAQDAIIERSLREVVLWDEVADRLDQSALRLSGGQQQRLCIARALALEPRVLLLDEPCSALDPPATDRIEELIGRLRGTYTMIIVTHNLAQARRVADHVAVLWHRDGSGRVIESGPMDAVFSNPSDPDAAAFIAGHTG